MAVFEGIKQLTFGGNTYKLAAGLSSNGVSAGTYGPTANVTASGKTVINIPELIIGATGLVSQAFNRSFTIPSDFYKVMTSAELSTGTSTDARLITPALLAAALGAAGGGTIPRAYYMYTGGMQYNTVGLSTSVAASTLAFGLCGSTYNGGGAMFMVARKSGSTIVYYALLSMGHTSSNSHHFRMSSTSSTVFLDNVYHVSCPTRGGVILDAYGNGTSTVAFMIDLLGNTTAYKSGTGATCTRII